jgi:hypothetical protein
MAIMFGNDGHRVNANLGGGVTVSFDGKHVGIGVNDLRDGVPAFTKLTLDEAAEVHGAIEHFLLTAAPSPAPAPAPVPTKPAKAPKVVEPKPVNPLERLIKA